MQSHLLMLCAAELSASCKGCAFDRLRAPCSKPPYTNFPRSNCPAAPALLVLHRPIPSLDFPARYSAPIALASSSGNAPRPREDFLLHALSPIPTDRPRSAKFSGFHLEVSPSFALLCLLPHSQVPSRARSLHSRVARTRPHCLSLLSTSCDPCPSLCIAFFAQKPQLRRFRPFKAASSPFFAVPRRNKPSPRSPVTPSSCPPPPTPLLASTSSKSAAGPLGRPT